MDAQVKHIFHTIWIEENPKSDAVTIVKTFVIHSKTYGDQTFDVAYENNKTFIDKFDGKYNCCMSIKGIFTPEKVERAVRLQEYLGEREDR